MGSVPLSGVRSDSSIFALSWPWEPWRGKEYVADGDQIRDYMEDTARKHGIFPHIRFPHHGDFRRLGFVHRHLDHPRDRERRLKTYRSRFVFFGTGYYNYDEPYSPDFPGLQRLRWHRHPRPALARRSGLHRQEDRRDRLRRNRRLAGAGAGLQRPRHHAAAIPGYLFAVARINRVFSLLRMILPKSLYYRLIRGYALTFEKVLW